jgi:hypothetical protein
MTRANYYLKMFTLFVALMMLLVCFTWMLYPYKTTEFYNSPFAVDKRIYTANDSIRIYMAYERFTKIKSTVIYRFTDGITFTMLPIMVQKTPGKFKGWVIPPIVVPSVLPAGKYYLDICYTYEVNPIRDVVVNARTQEFEVQ